MDSVLLPRTLLFYAYKMEINVKFKSCGKKRAERRARRFANPGVIPYNAEAFRKKRNSSVQVFHKEKNPKKFLSAPVRSDLGDVIAYSSDLFDFAISERASDIHIEPTRDSIIIRFRVSGDFMFVDRFSHDEYAKVISRIKIMANLRIDEKYRPQDGKIGYASEKHGESVDIRVSILPVTEGEKVVMRILRQDASLLDLDKLDFIDVNMERIKKSLASRYGIILVAGPTGSGKSTTLFSMLKHFDPLENNISTLEDPVEYNIPFINQSQIRPSVGF